MYRQGCVHKPAYRMPPKPTVAGHTYPCGPMMSRPLSYWQNYCSKKDSAAMGCVCLFFFRSSRVKEEWKGLCLLSRVPMPDLLLDGSVYQNAEDAGKALIATQGKRCE